MITVEGMLKGLVALVVNGTIKDSWHQNFINNVQSHVLTGNQLSTNQGAVILKISGKNAFTLAKALNVSKQDLELAIANPSYRAAPYESVSIKREVRYLGVDKLAFRFKMDPTVVAEIRCLKSVGDPVESGPRWDSQYRVWIVTVTHKNLDKIFSIIQNHKFDFDKSVLEYMTVCSNSKKVLSTFQAVEGEPIVVANICANPLLAYVVKNVLGGEEV